MSVNASIPLPGDDYRKKQTGDIKQAGYKWLALLTQWYRRVVSTIPFLGPYLSGHEPLRQQQLANVIFLSVGAISTIFFLPAFFHPLRAIYPLITAITCFISFLLNRMGKSFLASTLTIAAIEGTIFYSILTTSLNTNSLLLFDILAPAVLIAGLLLPMRSVFGIALVNIIFIFTDLTFQPRVSNIQLLMKTSSYVIYLQPMFSQIVAVLVVYFWVSSTRRETERANQAEEIAELQRIVALQNQQHIEAQYAEHMIRVAYTQQQSINKLKDQILLHVSHELLTPLTAISGYLDLLKEVGQNLDPMLQEHFLDNAREGCEELKQLIKAVQDTVQIDSIHNSPIENAVSVRQIVYHTLEDLDSQGTDIHTFCVDVPISLAVRANRQLLQQVLSNVLSNACKYSPAQTEILVSATQTKEDEICISIFDKGPGIPEEDIPLLFEKFARLKRDMTGSIRGMGLGLYMSKQIVEAMNGRIWIENSGGAEKGCRVCLTLPAATSEKNEEEIHPL